MLAYVDTSAALKLLVQEAESSALKQWLADKRPTPISTSPLGVELARACLPQRVLSPLASFLTMTVAPVVPAPTGCERQLVFPLLLSLRVESFQT